jgi:hypothetical protein
MEENDCGFGVRDASLAVRLTAKPLRAAAQARGDRPHRVLSRDADLRAAALVNYVWPERFGWPTTFFTAGWVALARPRRVVRAGAALTPRYSARSIAQMEVPVAAWDD